MSPICARGTETCALVGGSEKAAPGESDELPEFVRKAVALGYDESEVWELYFSIPQTRRDVNARRITPAGGIRRIDRMALAVAIAKAAGVAP